MQEWITSVGLMELNELTVTVRIAMAVICGGLLGFERTRKRRPAGLRTYALVCLGACVVMMTGIFLYDLMGGGFDPARMAAQVVCGIGFIGAGTIMVTRYHRVKGLTTAAGLWVSACLGLAIGVGFYFGALVTCVALVLIMVFADRFEVSYTSNLRRMRVYIVLDLFEQLKPLINYIQESDIEMTDIETTRAENKQGIGVFCTLKIADRKRTHAEIRDYLWKGDGVSFVEEIEG